MGRPEVTGPYYEEEKMELFMKFLVTLIQEYGDITLGEIVREYRRRAQLNPKQSRDLVGRLAEMGLDISEWDPDPDDDEPAPPPEAFEPIDREFD